MTNKKTVASRNGNGSSKSTRSADVLVKDIRSWWGKKYIVIKKTQVRSLYGFIVIAFAIGIFSAIIMAVNFNIQTKSKAVNTGTAVLSWNANNESDLAGYKIYYGTSPRTGTCPSGGYTSTVNAGKVTMYTISNLAEGQTYYFSIAAYNTAGKESCFSGEVSKAIPVAADTVAPTVSITAPSNNASISGTVNVTANASDNVGVAKVEFYADGSLKSTDTASPYAYSLDTTKLSNAMHQLTAKAYDAANNVGTSSSVSVTASNSVTCTSFVYSEWGPCQPDNTQTRTVISSSPTGCTGGSPVLTQSCQYSISDVTCTSFVYTKWSACLPDGTQTRTIKTSLPTGCTGGDPILTQTCTYHPNNGKKK